MSDTQETIAERYGWLSFPLLIFTASRTLLYTFAKAGPLFGKPMGVDVRLSPAFSRAYPALAALGHGEISDFARIARNGYRGAADIAIPPVVPYLGKGLGAALGSLELGLIVLSFVACAVGFAGAYRLFLKLRDAGTARAGVALLAAFPLSYHLSDGGSLACLLALSTWGVLYAVQGSYILSSAILSVGVLAHPACALFAIATIPLVSQGAQPQRPWEWRRRWVVVAPVLITLLWFGVMASRFGALGSGLRAALASRPELGGPGWVAVVSAFGVVLCIGGVLLLPMRGLWGLALAAAPLLYGAMSGWNTFSSFALAACWPAFLGLGAQLASRQNLRATVVALLCAHQGLLLYCFTHFLRSS